MAHLQLFLELLELLLQVGADSSHCGRYSWKKQRVCVAKEASEEEVRPPRGRLQNVAMRLAMASRLDAGASVLQSGWSLELPNGCVGGLASALIERSRDVGGPQECRGKRGPASSLPVQPELR